MLLSYLSGESSSVSSRISFNREAIGLIEIEGSTRVKEGIGTILEEGTGAVIEGAGI